MVAEARRWMRATFWCLMVMGQAGPAWAERKEQGNLVIDGIPDIPSTVRERMLQYQNVRGAAVADWLSGDEGLLMSTRFGETAQVHHIKAPGGARTQLTFFNEPVRGAVADTRLGKNGFYFLKDIGGNEFSQIYYFDRATGRSTMLSDGKSRNGRPLLTDKGDRFVYSSTRRNGKDTDIWLSRADAPDKAEILLQEGGSWGAVDWSPDDKRLVVSQYISANESRIFVLDVTEKKLERLFPDLKEVSFGAVQWAHDGKGLYYTSDEGGEHVNLWHYDLTSQKKVRLTADIPWDVDDVELSRDGQHLVFLTNESGISRLYMMSTHNKKYERLKAVPEGVIGGLRFHPRRGDLAMTLSTATSPGDIYVWSIGRKALQRWTNSEVGGLSEASFVRAEHFTYPTFDQVDGKPRQIPAFYYRPKKAKGPVPVVIIFHGGPEGQSTPDFGGLTQYFVNELGMAVVFPNVRGSTGYGKSFVKLDNGFLREDSVKDAGALLDWIAKNPALDAKRVGVMGGSYGGYMVLASLVHYSDRIRCGIDSVGISNFVTFLNNTQDYRRDLRRVEYGDERDPKMAAFLQQISPTTNASKIKSPLFVIQGQNDPRVPVGEAEQIVDAVRKNNVPVWYLLAKDEGHGFAKKQNRDYSNQATVLFLQQFLLGEKTQSH